MANKKTNFDKAYNKLLSFEGGYVNDKDDKGGETYKGIARNYNPDWNGWIIIDALKKNSNFPNNLYMNLELDKRVKEFYKQNYWDIFDGDNLNYNVAEEVFDIAVNCGLKRATTFIQMTCNLLNRNGKLYKNILVDGVFGPITKQILNTCILINGDKIVFNVLNILQGSYYIELMMSNEKNEKYIGWFNRIEIRR